MSQNSRSATVKPGAQAVDVGATLRGRNQIDVGFLGQLAFGQPGKDEIDAAAFACVLAQIQFRRQMLGIAEHRTQIIAQAVFVMPLFLLAAGCIGQAHGQAGAEHRLGAQNMLELWQGIFDESKYFSSGQNRNVVPVCFFGTLPVTLRSLARSPLLNAM